MPRFHHALQGALKHEGIKLSQEEIAKALKCLAAVSVDELMLGQEVRLPGLVTLHVEHVPERSYVNPRDRSAPRIVKAAHRRVAAKSRVREIQ